MGLKRSTSPWSKALIKKQSGKSSIRLTTKVTYQLFIKRLQWKLSVWMTHTPYKSAFYRNQAVILRNSEKNLNYLSSKCVKISTGSLKLTKYEFYANFFLTFCKWRKRSRHKFHNRAKYVDPCRHRQKIEISFRQYFPHLIISRKLG